VAKTGKFGPGDEYNDNFPGRRGLPVCFVGIVVCYPASSLPSVMFFYRVAKKKLTVSMS
jgi:hypothetical protein